MRETTLGRFADIDSSDTELGRAQRRAAAFYDAPFASYQVHGSTGANAVALRAHQMQGGSLRVLVARGAHHSVINELIALGGTLRFVRGSVDSRFEAALPPSPSIVREALETGDPVDVVVVTSPTYEGFNADVAGIARVVHDHGARLHVDSAWGPLLGAHPSLPLSPVALGADTSSISVHKLAGGLSQAALLTWREDRLQRGALRAAHAQYCTTSPNYEIAASIDQSIIDLELTGKDNVERAVGLRNELRDKLKGRLGGLEVLEAGPGVRNIGEHLDSEKPVDNTRLTIGLAGYDVTGFLLADALRARGIVPEKAGVQTLTLFIPTGAEADWPDLIADAIVGQLAGRRRNAEQPRADLLPDPLRGLAVAPEIEPASAARRAISDGESVPLAEAAGRICLELVEAYPPGIPIGVPGFRLTPEAVEYLEAVQAAGGDVVALDLGETPGAGKHICVLPE